MQLRRSGSVCLLKWRIRKFIFLRSVASKAHKSPYVVLGVTPKADTKEIKEKFYKLSKEHHPDISKDDSSLEKFREIADAYETLSNPELRNKYDQVSRWWMYNCTCFLNCATCLEGEWVVGTSEVATVSASRSQV